MELGRYKVDVVHFINPHLIWVLVQKEGDKEAIYFEQIGIYGILPQNVTTNAIGIVNCVLKAEHCEQWMPAASVAMERCFHEAQEIWFSPTYIDKKSSLFNNSTHKYGDLLVVKKNGDKVNLLEVIVNSKFAHQDECLFHQKLMSNNLDTKLNYITMHEVLKNIEEAHKTRNIPKKIWLDVLKNQTSVQKGQQLESKDMSRRVPARQLDDMEKLLKNKQNVLKLCKDVDEVSVGRACGPRSSSTSVKSGVVSLGLKKKLEWLESQSIANKTKASRPGEAIHSENQPNMHANHSDVKTDDDADEHNNNTPSTKQKNHLSRYGKGKKPRGPDDRNFNLVAFGPAGLPINKFHLQVMPTEVKEEEPVPEVMNPEPEQELQVKKNEDVYADVDSEVDLQITNLALLQRISCQQNKSKNKMKAKGETLNAIKHKIKSLEEKQQRLNDSVSSVSDKNSSICDLDSDDDSITQLEEKLDLHKINKNVKLEPQLQSDAFDTDVKTYNVNPFKNVDGTISVFVDKLVTPVLMVHTKNDNRIVPISNMRDIPFGKDIHIVLRNMGVHDPMRPQTVSWPTILRGHSVFLVGPYNSGKTMGYLPAVCRLVSDFKNTPDNFGLSCIIVCATSYSVASVEYQCQMFLHSAKIFACYVGMSNLHITTTLLNGCDILICTPTMLVRLIHEDFALDFRSLNTFVVDDCERISTTYPNELKFCLLKVKDIVKNRAHKEWKVQHVIVSRVWCDFMSSLARKAPDSVVCISAFQECVLYSKAATSVEFVALENKLCSVKKFLEGIDKSKKTVIVCRADDEVKLIEKTLKTMNYAVFSCDSTMDVQELYKLGKILKEYEEPVLGPILVCCDGNLTHLNVTDSHYLVHYSLPDLFSTFCKRFAVLIDNYPSVFKVEENNIKIKILFDNNNIKQLPKILHFIKRCTQDVPHFLDEISSSVLTEKYLEKAQNLVPICTTLLTLGKCPDYWNCIDRHAIFKEFDSPKPWLPKEGVITFRILHYHSAVHYSARVTSCTVNSNVTKYQHSYSSLSIKMGMYYSKAVNRKLHGVCNVGDVCAVTLMENLFVRCQVSRVLRYEKNRPTLLRIKLLDEEKYETSRDTSLYYLPDDLKNIETHVVSVILANLMPQDKDVTFSKLAENQLKRITDENDEIDMRGQITMVVGNTILVDTLEACQSLSSLEEVVVKCDFRKELLDGYAIPNPDHIDDIRKACDFNNDISKEKLERVEVANLIKTLPKGSWAHLESGQFTSVFFIVAENPSQFFIRLVKFDTCLTALVKDIEKHVTENPEPIENINVGDIVIAEFPDDATPERARIDSDIKHNKVKCFFVDQGESRDVAIKKVYPITEKFITQLPFQAIECRLVGIKPFGESWTDFSTNFFADSCFNSFDKNKELFTKYFTKEKADFTEGHKYGVVLIDTYSEEDVNINLMLVDKNLAEENDEIELLQDLGFERKSEDSSDSDKDDEPGQSESKIDRSFIDDNMNKQIEHVSSKMPNTLIRSVPLVGSDSSLDDFELVHDNGYLGSIPLSQIFSIKQLPNSQWNDKVLATPVDNSLRPSNVASSIDNSKRPSNVASSIDNSKRPSDKTSIDTFVRPSDVSNSVSKPKLLWRQNKTTVTIKIKLIVDDYDLTIGDRSIAFSAKANNTTYEFDFELYGVVDLSKSSHCNKGQYIQVMLRKVMATNWLMLTRYNDLKKWIVYDTESINVSSDEEPEMIDHRKNLISNIADSDSDEYFKDDTQY